MCYVCQIINVLYAIHLLFVFLISLLWLPASFANAESIDKKTKKSEYRALNTEHFFGKHAEGWHWYQHKEETLNEHEDKKPELSPSQQIESQRKELEKKLHAAIIEPSHENIIIYLKTQKALMDQSQRFADSWKDVLYRTPSLDETLIHPTDQNARHIYYDEQNKSLQSHIKALASEYGLFFFFRGNCPYCHGFSHIVKRFSQKYGWSVLPISLDGGSVAEFSQIKQDNGIAKTLNITHVPALIALHPQSGKLIPLSYSMISEAEIEERVRLLTSLEEKK